MGRRVIVRRRTEQESVTLQQAFDSFIAEKEAVNLAKKTTRAYKATVRLFMAFHELPAETKCNEVTVTHVHEWVNDMRKRELSGATLNHYISHIRAFLYWCMNNEFMGAFKISNVRVQEEQLKLYTDEELLALLKRPDKNDGFCEWRSWAVVNWILATGNRASTVCDIRINCVDFTAKEIQLRHTKNKRAQIVPLSPALEKVLREYIRTWRYGVSGDSWLFPSVEEGRLNAESLRVAHARYCKKCGVTKTTIHGLRHNFARGWVKNGGNAFALQKVLGHSSLNMTKRYVNLFSEDIKEDFDRYSPLDTMKRSSTGHEHLVKRR